MITGNQLNNFMEIKKLKSCKPTFHDNTESDLIIVPSGILDNKLRDFEIYHSAKSSLPSDITLAVTFIVAIFAANFINPPFLDGSTIRGFFGAGLFFVLIKIGFSLYQIFWANGHARAEIISGLKSPSKKK